MVYIPLSESEAALLQEERKRILLRRLGEIREATRRYRFFGAALVAVGMFLALLSWVALGLGFSYLVAGAVGSALVGAGLYLLVTEPRLGGWITLSDEVEEALGSCESPSELRAAVEEAVARHPDERILAGILTRILSSTGDSNLREELEGVLRTYARQGV